MGDEITVVDNSFTVTVVEDNYTIHVLEGLGIPGPEGPPGGGLTNPVTHIQYQLDPAGVPEEEGVQSWDLSTHMPKVISDIPGPQGNVMLESWTRIRNKTAAVILNGRAVVGASSDDPYVFNVAPACATPELWPKGSIAGITTNELQPWVDGVEAGEGWATTRGNVSRDSTPFFPMAPLFITDVPANAGELVTEAPSPPNYPISMGFSKDQTVDGKIYVFATNPGAVVSAVDAAWASGDPTGFHDGDNIAEHYDPVARTMTLSHASGILAYTWRGQVKYKVSPWTSPAHPDILDTGFFLYSLDGENFGWAEAAWDFDDIMMAFAWYGTDDKFGIREPHGLMPHQSHKQGHQVDGTYRESGGDVAGYIIGSTVPAERRPTVSSARVKDEDSTTINALMNDSLYTRGYLTGAGIFTMAKDSADINDFNGNIPYWNDFDGNDWIQTEVAQNQYMSIFVAEVPATDDAGSQKYRLLWVQGQSSGTLNDQLNETTQALNLGNFQALFTEFVFIEHQIMRYQAGNWHLAASIRLTGTRNQQVGSPSGNYLSAVEHGLSLKGSGTTADPLDVQSYKSDLAPGVGETATVDAQAAYDYTIAPTGASFTLDLVNIPEDGEAWSVTIYAIDWDGVAVTMPAGSVTPDAAGLSFTSGGGKDRIIARGNAGPAGEKEFYNLPGNMG